MKNISKIITVVCSVVIVLAGVLALVFYFSFKPSHAKEEELISLEDMTIEVGSSQIINFQLLNQDVKVRFSVADDNIALLEGESIKAKKQGVTFLKADASMNGRNYSTIAQIKVVNKSGDDNSDEVQDDNKPWIDEPSIVVKKCYYSIKPIQNCEIVENKLVVGDTAVFSIELFVNLAMTIHYNYTQVEVVCPEDIVITRELGNFVITAKKSGTVTFRFPEKDFDFQVQVELK